MTDYAVFSRRILTGTIADLPYAARLAWQAILFEAEALRGRVKIPTRDLARWACITPSEAAEAMRLFQEPDPFSSTKDEEGRRLRAVEGEEDWYVVVSWEKHADEREVYFARLRKQRQRARERVVTNSAITAQRYCDCCGDIFAEPYSKYVVRDHNHETGQERGFVCAGCNAIIGIIERGQVCASPKNLLAAAYLKKWASRDVTSVTKQSRRVTKEPEPEPEPEPELKKTLSSKASPPTTEKRFEKGSPPFDLSCLLLLRIKQRNPKHKEPDLQKWAEQVDLLMRRDGRDVAEIRKVIEWCQADAFWQNNILSTAKLREKFDELLLKSQPKAPVPQQTRTIVSGPMLSRPGGGK